MKKLLIVLCLMFTLSLSAFANLLPFKVSDIPLGTIGVYQTTNGLTTYTKPDTNSVKNFEKSWNYSTVFNTNLVDSLFAILIEKKELSFVYATDIDEDFVQVVYDKGLGKAGWAAKIDDFQFLPWITFYNLYGRKYGLKLLKGVPPSILELHSKSERDSQILAKLNRPKEIRFTAIQGNWALVTVLDIDNVVKTGYIQWRGENGELYLFPAIK